MGFVYDNHKYVSLHAYMQGSRGVIPQSDTGAPRYAHPVDGTLLQALEALPVQGVLRPIANHRAAVASATALANGIIVSPKAFLDLWRIVSHCAKVLGIPTPMTVAIGTSEMNAYTSGTDEKAFICVSTTLMRLCSFEEASFVIGHECGHIHCHHVMYHMLADELASAAGAFGGLGTLIARTAGLTLSAWSRRSEISCDRAGLLCCGDLRVAERSLIRLITGFAEIESVNLEDYLNTAQGMESEMPGTGLAQLYFSHPSIPRRIRALRLFSESSLYYELSGKEPPPGQVLLSREELDSKIGAIIQ